MKTSTKLLITIAVLLLSTIVISALAFRYKFSKGDYTVINFNKSLDEMQKTVLENPITQVEILGSIVRFDIRIVKDTINFIQMTKDLPVLIQEVGEALTIHPKTLPSDESFFKNSDAIHTINIHLMDLESIKQVGLIDTITRTRNNRVDRTFVYHGQTVYVEGFQKRNLDINMSIAGHIQFKDVIVDHMNLHLDGTASSQLDSTNSVQELLIFGRDRSKFSLKKPRIQTLKTNLLENAELKLQGINFP